MGRHWDHWWICNTLELWMTCLCCIPKFVGNAGPFIAPEKVLVEHKYLNLFSVKYTATSLILNKTIEENTKLGRPENDLLYYCVGSIAEDVISPQIHTVR